MTDDCDIEKPLTDDEILSIARNSCCAVLPPGVMDEEQSQNPSTLALTSFPGPSMFGGSSTVLTAWGYRRQMWEQGRRLRVRFINGTRKQRDAAADHFKMIDKWCGLSIAVVLSGPSECRVAFDLEAGHWSYVGKDNLSIAPNQKTMNLGLTGNEGENELSRVIIHEGFHLLGFGHEHQHPRATIPWNVPNVYAVYGRTQGWSRSQIFYQVLRRSSAVGMVGTPNADKSSIMMYSIDRRLVTDPKWEVKPNFKPSEQDLAILATIYS